MSGPTDKCYRLHSTPPNLHWAGWDDEYVVFDEASGQTHQLDAVRAFVLHTLSEGPQTTTDIICAFAELLTFPKESVTHGNVVAIFSEFETCGLVEVVAQ